MGLFSSTSIDLIKSGQKVSELKVTVSGLQDGADEGIILDGSVIALEDGVSDTTQELTGNELLVDYSISISAGTATITITKSGDISSANAQTLVDGLGYTHIGFSPTVGNRTVTVTSIKDDGGTANGGSDTTALSVATTINVKANSDGVDIVYGSAINDTFSGGLGADTLSGGAGDDQFIYDSSDTAINGDANNDVGAGGGDILLVSENIDFASQGVDINTMEFIDVEDGQATTLSNLSSQNVLDMTDGNNTLYIYGDIGGDDQLSVSGTWVNAGQVSVGGYWYNNYTLNGATLNLSHVDLTGRNDAPNLYAVAQNTDLTPDANQVGVFATGTVVDLIESSDVVTELKIEVAGLLDGANEKIILDGVTPIAPTNGASGTTTGGILVVDYSIAVSNGTATITITKTGNIGAADAGTLIDGIGYSNTTVSASISEGLRAITVSSVKDNGGTANDGADTSADTLVQGVVNVKADR